KAQTDVPSFDDEDIASIQKINQKNTQQIAKIIEKLEGRFGNSIISLEQDNNKLLIDNKKSIKKLNKSIDGLKSEFYLLIKKVEPNVMDSSKYLIKSYGNLQNIILGQDLIKIDQNFSDLLTATKDFFLQPDSQQAYKINELSEKTREIIDFAMSREISRIKKDKTSQKSNTLFMSILLESNYVVDRINKLVSSYESNII